MFGRNVSIPFSNIDSITLYTKDGYDSDAMTEGIGWILGIALFVSVL